MNNENQSHFLRDMALGAALMYYFDPDKGKRRRTLLRDQVTHWSYQAEHALDVAGRDMRNRSNGIAAETWHRLQKDDADDQVIEARVRSALGRLVSHPRAIKAEVEDGYVTLSGPVLESEVDHLLSKLRRVRGVRQVRNRLEVHAEAGNVPELQGEGHAITPSIDVLQENWAPSTRLLMGLLGTAIVARGRKSPFFSPFYTALGSAVLVRALTNYDLNRIAGIDAGDRAVDFHKILNVQTSVEEAFDFWSNFENFPRFMSHLLSVQNTGEGRSHWIARGPAGVSFAWDAEITSYEENRLIAWKSIGNSPVRNSGVVKFSENRRGGVCIDIQMSYNPPAGVMGHALASLFRADPKHAMDDDLGRLKMMLEQESRSGENTSASGAENLGRS